MGAVFINYRVGDGALIAGFLHGELVRAFGTDEVFYASRRLGPGSLFDEEILAALRDCDVLLAIIGPRWLGLTNTNGTRRLDEQDDWVRREIAEALALQIRVIPVLVEDAPMPRADQLPEDMRGPTRCTYLRLGHRHGEGDAGTLIAHLRDTVPRLAAMKAVPATITSDEPARDSRHQLPADTGTFTGREPELARLLEVAETCLAAGGTGTIVIFAIDGMAGVGKTALAIHTAHRLGHLFSDGVLYVELNGYALDRPPRDPAEALASVLISLGVPPQRIPDDLSGRAAAYRDRLSGRRMLIVLDSAAGEQQIRPLLPGSPGCLVLITSRRRLAALDEAHALPLDVLPPPEAIALLRTTATPAHVPDSADGPLLAEIAELCGRLPLALRIAGAMLRTGRAHSLTNLADQLRGPHPDHAHLVDLAGFRDGGRNLAAVIDRSYQTLDPEQQLLYRRLGLIPGPDTDRYAAAALLDATPTDADRLLADLVDHNLLTQRAPGRYQMHDLVRAHAYTLTEHDPTDEREAARERLLNYYQHTANTADTLTSDMPRHSPDGPAPTYAPTLPDSEAAWAWLRTERPTCSPLSTRPPPPATNPPTPSS